MAAPKFIVNMRLTGIVHMHHPGFHAKIVKKGGDYELDNIVRWPFDKEFKRKSAKYNLALQDALTYIREKATERKNNPDWLYPV